MDGVNKNPGRNFNGKDLEWLLDAYLEESATRIAATTHKDYSLALDYFRRWWRDVGPKQDYIVGRSDFQKFAKWLEKQPSRQGERLGVGTIDTVLKRLRQFFRWSWTEENLAKDYSLWIPRATGEPPERTLPEPESLDQLFNAATLTEKPIRNRAILAILIGTAVRRAECCNIDIEHVQFYADGGGQISIKLGKGKKPRTVIFDAIAGEYISIHLRWMVESGHATGALFLGRSGRLGPKALYSVVKNLAEHAGLADQIQGPHDLRRLFATYWSRKQRGEGFTQPLSLQMGHTDRKMTLLYTKQDITDVRQTFTSPLEKLTKK